MPRSYTVVKGDTFAGIARKLYGDDLKSPLIARANPGVAEPLQVGAVLATPTDTSGLQTTRRPTSAGQDDVTISVDGVTFRQWTSVSVTREIDAVDVATFAAPFEPDLEAFRDVFTPFKFQDVAIALGGAPLFTGTLVSPNPAVNPTASTVSASCYSLPGVLGDCTAPASAFPLEWSLATLETVAKDLAGMFGLSVVFESPPGALFERVALAPGAVIMPFLANLASQRDLIIGTTANGEVAFRKAESTGAAVVALVEGQPPLVSTEAQYQPQKVFSSVTGIAPVIIGLPGAQYTERNTLLSGVLRPYTFNSPDLLDSDLPASVQSKNGRMWANAIIYTVNLSTWRDPSGNLWTPNTFVTLQAPRAFVYEKTRFLIKAVELTHTNKKKTAQLTLVLPGALAGETPGGLPWGD